MIFSREKTIKLAMENSNNNDYLILQFVDKKVLDAFNVLTSEDSSMSLEDVAYTIAEVFYQGNAKAFVSDFVKEDNVYNVSGKGTNEFGDFLLFGVYSPSSKDLTCTKE